MPELRLTCGKKISIHDPARGATFCHLLALLNTRNFNPRSREGSDGPSDVTLLTVPVFQSTLPRGERHLPQTRCPENVYFNPRSREGSDEDVTTKVDSLEISIHAPARGATSTYQHTHYSTRISIHAPARGATDFSDFFKFFLRISIHAPARGATVDPFFGSLDHVISIHAPARGATFGTLRSIPAASLFQSTLPRGERLLCGANLKLVIQFQSTLPRGERRNTQPRSAERRNFNPRSREGSDDAGAEACYIAAHFNPRSREGSD